MLARLQPINLLATLHRCFKRPEAALACVLSTLADQLGTSTVLTLSDAIPNPRRGPQLQVSCALTLVAAAAVPSCSAHSVLFSHRSEAFNRLEAVTTLPTSSLHHDSSDQSPVDVCRNRRGRRACVCLCHQ